VADYLQDGRDRALSQHLAPVEPLVLCHLEEIADGGAKGFYPDGGAVPIALFVLRRGKKLYAYKNRCPHLGSPLEMHDDRFLTTEGDFIVCATHGALFRIEDGTCVAGPCAGKSLEPLDVTCDDDGQMRLSLSADDLSRPADACHCP